MWPPGRTVGDGSGDRKRPCGCARRRRGPAGGPVWAPACCALSSVRGRMPFFCCAESAKACRVHSWPHGLCTPCRPQNRALRRRARRCVGHSVLSSPPPCAAAPRRIPAGVPAGAPHAVRCSLDRITCRGSRLGRGPPGAEPPLPSPAEPWGRWAPAPSRARAPFPRAPHRRAPTAAPKPPGGPSPTSRPPPPCPTRPRPAPTASP